MGSPMYMSPEQAGSDKTLDARSDVHALGVVTWECLVGKAPYLATNFNKLMVEIVTGPRRLLRDAMPEAPASVEALLTKAFARDREERFADAREFAAAIERELLTLGVTETLDARTSAELFFSKLPAETTAEPGAPPYVARRRRSSIDPAPVDPPSAPDLPAPSVLAQTTKLRPTEPEPNVSLYAVVAVIAIVAGGVWYVAKDRASASAQEVAVASPVIAAPAQAESSIVPDAGSKNSSARPPKPARLPAPKTDFRRGVSGDGF